jgi:hypothetical protein
MSEFTPMFYFVSIVISRLISYIKYKHIMFDLQL